MSCHSFLGGRGDWIAQWIAWQNPEQNQQEPNQEASGRSRLWPFSLFSPLFRHLWFRGEGVRRVGVTVGAPKRWTRIAQCSLLTCEHAGPSGRKGDETGKHPQKQTTDSKLGLFACFSAREEDENEQEDPSTRVSRPPPSHQHQQHSNQNGLRQKQQLGR